MLNGHALLLAKYRSQAADLSAEGSSDVLRTIRDKILNRCHYVVEQCFSGQQTAEAWNLACNCSPDFSLGILKKLDECWNKISRNNFIVHCFRDLQTLAIQLRIQSNHSFYLLKSVGYHVSHSPALVLNKLSQGGQEHAMT